MIHGNFNIGDRIHLISKGYNQLILTGYIRKMNNSFITIQSQRGYTKIYSLEKYYLQIHKKKSRSDITRNKYEKLLNLLNKQDLT